MKKLYKMILVAIPALVVAAAVGMTTIGCGDDTTSTGVGNDLSMSKPADMAKAGPDLLSKGD